MAIQLSSPSYEQKHTDQAAPHTATDVDSTDQTTSDVTRRDVCDDSVQRKWTGYSSEAASKRFAFTMHVTSSCQEVDHTRRQKMDLPGGRQTETTIRGNSNTHFRCHYQIKGVLPLSSFLSNRQALLPATGVRRMQTR